MGNLVVVAAAVVHVLIRRLLKHEPFSACIVLFLALLPPSWRSDEGPIAYGYKHKVWLMATAELRLEIPPTTIHQIHSAAQLRALQTIPQHNYAD